MDIRAIIEQAGATDASSRTYDGRTLWYFRDPETGTTLALYENVIVDAETVRKHMEFSREKFRENL